MDSHEGSGYGYALMNGDIVITPYIDPSDFPTIRVDSIDRILFAEVVLPSQYRGWTIEGHSGSLEELYYKQTGKNIRTW